jgi:plastocyanin
MRIRYLAFLLCAAAGGRVTGTVTVVKDGAPKPDRSGVVVYLEGAGPVTPPAERPRIKQKDQQFAPGLMVVPRGTTVEFPNEDRIFHNVFSVSSAARFDLGLYKSGETRQVTFKRPGTVDVYCNIHPNMVARVKVVDSPHYAVTGPDGRFAIEGVPAGTYPLVAWQAWGDERRGEVTVTEGGTATVKLELVEGKPDRGHLRKDGTPYGRYR